VGVRQVASPGAWCKRGKGADRALKGVVGPLRVCGGANRDAGPTTCWRTRPLAAWPAGPQKAIPARGAGWARRVGSHARGGAGRGGAPPAVGAPPAPHRRANCTVAPKRRPPAAFGAAPGRPHPGRRSGARICNEARAPPRPTPHSITSHSPGPAPSTPHPPPKCWPRRPRCAPPLCVARPPAAWPASRAPAPPCARCGGPRASGCACGDPGGAGCCNRARRVPGALAPRAAARGAPRARSMHGTSMGRGDLRRGGAGADPRPGLAQPHRPDPSAAPPPAER
jgi:hypothetical protein